MIAILRDIWAPEVDRRRRWAGGGVGGMIIAEMLGVMALHSFSSGTLQASRERAYRRKPRRMDRLLSRRQGSTRGRETV